MTIHVCTLLPSLSYSFPPSFLSPYFVSPSLSLAPLSLTQDLARRLHEEEKQAARRQSHRQPQQPHPQDAVSSQDKHKYVLYVADALCFTFGEVLEYKASPILLVCHLSFFLLPPTVQFTLIPSSFSLPLYSFTLIHSPTSSFCSLSSLHPGPSQETPWGGNASC